jgi:hypothetical protein
LRRFIPDGVSLKFRKIFDLPEGIISFGLAVLGWPDQKNPSKERYSDECIHYNTW